MTLQDLEHRLENVEAQHADYVRTLSAHTSTLAVVVAELAVIRQSLVTVVAEVAALRQDMGAIRRDMDQRHAEIMAQFEKLLARPSEN